MIKGSLDEEVIDGTWGTKNVRGSIGSQGEEDNDDQKDKSVNPISQDSGLETSDEGVCNDTDGEKIDFDRCQFLWSASLVVLLTSSNGMHAGQGRDGGRTTDDKHERHQDVGNQTKHHEDDVGNGSITSLDDLKESMGVGSTALEFDGESSEQKNLDSGT